MVLETIEIRNFRVLKDCSLDLQGKSTVFFGENGIGKSTVLAALNYLFYFCLPKDKINKAFPSLQSADFHVGSEGIHSHLELRCNIVLDNGRYPLGLYYDKVDSALTKNKLKKTYYADFIKNINDVIQDDLPLPIYVNYSTNRSVVDIPLRLKAKREASKLDAWDDAIESNADFRAFFQWFRDREDLENQTIKAMKDFNYKDKQLECVRKAITSMLGDFTNLRVERSPLCMMVDKGDISIQVDLLSDGEKCTLALLGDLARRIAIANNALPNPLQGRGIVTIDEIELHMHPQWQRRIMGVLRKVFPNMQFIVTTHSPQVLSELDDSYNIYSMKRDKNNEVVFKPVKRLDGWDSNTILESYMQTGSQNAKLKQLREKINREIVLKEYNDAEKDIAELITMCGTENENVIMAQGFLKRSRILDAKNQQK